MTRKIAFIIYVAPVLLIFCAQKTLAQEGQVRARARIYEAHIAAAAARHGVDARILWTIAYLETRFRADLVSPKGARGLMQFMPGTAARYGLSDPLDPAASIDAAARYVRFLTLRFGGRVDLILAGYNAGEGAVEAFRDGRRLILQSGKVINSSMLRTNGVPPYRETQNYVALGTSVLTSITSARLFNAAPLVQQPSIVALTAQVRHDEQQASQKTDELDSPALEKRRDSLYIHASIETEEALTKIDADPSIVPPTNPTPQPSIKTSTTHSIYFQ